MLRPLLIVAAVLCAWLAQQPGNSAQVSGWVIAASLAAMLLAGLAVPTLPLRPPSAALSPPASPRTLLSGACLIAVPTLVATAIWLREPFHDRQQFVNAASSWAAVLWLLGIAAGLVYLWQHEPSRKERRPFAAPRPLVLLEALAVVVILDIALGLRVWQLGSLPEGIWFDEADFAAAVERLDSMPFQPLGPGVVSHVPSAYLYCMALVMKLAGTSIAGIRLTSALFGTLAVGAVFLLGRRVGNVAYGLCGATLLAIGKWASDFSRIGMSNIAAPAMTSLGFACTCVAMLWPTAFWFCLSGVVLGFSVLTYLGAVLPGVAVVMTVVMLRLVTSRAFRAAAWPSVLFLPLGMALGAAPFLAALRLDPGFTLSRESTVSLLTQYPAWPDRITTFLSNTRLHLLMFTVQGDQNGRHNFPGAPMLDPVTGALFLLGLGMCLRRLGHWYCQLLLLWLGASLLGGILSLSFEAPQGARTITAVAPVALIAALPLALMALALWHLCLRARPAPGAVEVESRFARPPQVLAGLALAACVTLVPLGVAARDNFNDYFVRQASDAGAWAEMGGLQALLGRTAIALDHRGYAVRIPQDINGDIAFELAANGQAFPTYDASVPVSLPVPAAGIALLVPDTAADVFSYVTRSYPEAEVVPLTPAEIPANVQARAILISRHDVEQNMGATVRFGSGPASHIIQHVLLPAAWPDDVSDTAMLQSTLALGTFEAAVPASYRVVGLAHGTMHIDGYSWPVSTGGTRLMVLGAGNHVLTVSGSGRSAGAVSLEFSRSGMPWMPLPASSVQAPSLPTGGLLGAYYQDPRATQAPAFLRVDQFVNAYYQNPPGNLSFPFAVRWLGSLDLKTTGYYGFSLDSMGASALSIDGRQLLTSGSPVSGTRFRSVKLTSGVHALRLEYQAEGSYLHCYLQWSPPGHHDYLPLPPSVTQPAHM